MINIAIDGYSSCGKSTLAKDLARKLGYVYLDTGSMYRMVTLFALNNNLVGDGRIKEEDLVNSLDQISISFKVDHHQQFAVLNNEVVEDKIRSMDVSNWVSETSKIKAVRKKMVRKQKEIARNKGVVMDGRDIGTVVLPDAELKLFMTAAPEIRAKRRYNELTEKGVEVSMEEVKANLRQRDHEDTHRKESPLLQAEDAVVLDNSHMSTEQQLRFALSLARERMKSGSNK